MSGRHSIENESLLPGSSTFTLERIQSQLQKDTYQHDPNTSPRHRSTPVPFSCEVLEYSFSNGMNHIHLKKEQPALRQKLCHDLLLATTIPEDHCSQLDNVLSGIVTCNFQPNETVDEISLCASRLLMRLPARPLPLPKESIPIHPSYLSTYFGQPLEFTEPDKLWYDLEVTSYVSVNVIRISLLFVIYRCPHFYGLDSFLNTIAKLLTTASTLSSLEQSPSVRQRWFIVRAFLWTCWQRCNMMYFVGVLRDYLIRGYDLNDRRPITLDGMKLSPDLSIQEMSRISASRHKPRYMCGWAFELLRSHSVCVGLDFRRFFSRYSMIFGARKGRCIEGHPEGSCLGDDPDRCQRFKGMRIENQSAHDISCDGTCKRLFWDEVSYRSISGARAVDLGDSDSRNSLIYRSASSTTLAISHVWSHGQGGRPEEGPLEKGHGLNGCLHRRYVSIANSLGCDSYWMDTPCIPEDHSLRREAIGKINEIFEYSKVTLVCDKDLMAIDASHITTEVCELILATVVVCDWNIRAWTFLEAFRGRSNVHILCKNNVVSLKETIKSVCEEGAVDIALLLLSAPHLLASWTTRESGNSSLDTISGFLSVEAAGTLLNHRAASRPGDDIVIWSLLLGDKVYEDAKTFWRSREGHYLPTAFLVSSAPRLVEQKGLTWAPASPTAQLTWGRPNNPQRRLLPYDGVESVLGTIKKDGFLASWLGYEFTGSCVGARLSTYLKIQFGSEHPSYYGNLQTIRRRYLRGFYWGVLLRPESRTRPGDLATYRGDAVRTLVIVCATNHLSLWPWEKDDVVRWIWRGVYEWDRAEPLPEFSGWEILMA